MNRLSRFWARISDGMAIEELWTQLRRDTTSGYRMYAQEAKARAPEPDARARRRRADWSPGTAIDFVWAIVMKMSPARRVVLLIALVLLATTWLPLGVLLLLGLLALEISDRVAMKRDLEIAREIQLWLLPKTPPQIPGAGMAFTNLPANTVSGDFYDAFFGAESGRLMLAVADVAGKGVPAAMLMATFQASLRTLASEGLDLNAITPALNRYACGSSQGGTRFTTAVIADYDPLTRRLRYANAGHNPPLLRRAGGAIERLERGGVPLGILAEATFECAEVELLDGDALVIFSDGMTESFSESGEEYGEARLIAALEREEARAGIGSPGVAGPARGAEALLAALVEDCSRFRGGARQQDDLTCMVIRVGPGGAACP